MFVNSSRIAIHLMTLSLEKMLSSFAMKDKVVNE